MLNNPYNIVIHGTALTPGASDIPIDGTVISFGTDELVVGSKTERDTFSNLLLVVAAEESTASGGTFGEVIISGVLGRLVLLRP